MIWLEEHIGLVKAAGGFAYCAMLATLTFGLMTATWILLAVAILLSALWVALDSGDPT